MTKSDILPTYQILAQRLNTQQERCSRLLRALDMVQMRRIPAQYLDAIAEKYTCAEKKHSYLRKLYTEWFKVRQKLTDTTFYTSALNTPNKSDH